MRGRFRIVTILMVMGGLFLGCLLVDRMIVNKKKYATSRYVDKKFVEVVHRLDEAGVFIIDGRLIRINEEVFGQKRLNGSTREKIRQAVNSGAIYASNGEIAFNSGFCARVNPKRENLVRRGAFLDRNGIPLTKTTINEKHFSITREYPFGRIFSPIVGHFNDIYGMRNLEKELDRHLSGKAHSPIFMDESNPLQRIVLGDDVTLTLDSDLQRYGYSVMGETKGAIAVLDVKTGEVLAAVSTPSYDPNTKDKRQWERISSDKTDRFYENRVFSTLYPLGSTFKTVVAVTWLDTSRKGDGREGFTIFCTGRPNRYKIADEYKEHGHGTVNLEKGLIQSCNPFFSELGVALGASVYDYAVRFGFNSPINLIPQIEGHAFLTTRSLAYSYYEYKEKEKILRTFKKVDFKRNKGIVAQCAIGQNLVSATPLQMAMVAASIANGGRVLNPYVVREIRNARGKSTVVGNRPVVLTDEAMRESTARITAGLMKRVMLEGTGKNVKKLYFENGTYTTEPAGPGAIVVHVAGKTGTAETGRDEKPHSWFIGFAPADNPQVAIAVIVENSGKGGAVAAPKAVDMCAKALNALSGKVGS